MTIQLALASLLANAPADLEIRAAPDEAALLEDALEPVLADPVASPAEAVVDVAPGGPIHVTVRDPQTERTVEREIETDGEVTSVEAEEAALVVQDAIKAFAAAPAPTPTIEDKPPPAAPAAPPTFEDEPPPPAAPAAQPSLSQAPPEPHDEEVPPRFRDKGVVLGFNLGVNAVFANLPDPRIGPGMLAGFELGYLFPKPRGSNLRATLGVTLDNQMHFAIYDRADQFGGTVTTRVGVERGRWFPYVGASVGAGFWAYRQQDATTTKAVAILKAHPGVQVRVGKRTAIGLEVVGTLSPWSADAGNATIGAQIVVHRYFGPRQKR